MVNEPSVFELLRFDCISALFLHGKRAYYFVSLRFSYFYSPALKKWGYTGFAMYFCHSVIPSFRDSGTAKLKCILLYNFYVCGPTSMKLILHLVSKVNKVYSQKSGQGPITFGVMSIGRFSTFKMHFA